MKSNKILVSALALGASILLGGSLSAQSFNIFIVGGTVLKEGGASGDFGTGLNGFYAKVDSALDLSFDSALNPLATDSGLLAIQEFSYTALVDGSAFAGPGAYMNPTAPANESISNLFKVVVVFTDALTVGDIGPGSMVGVGQTTAFNGVLDNRNIQTGDLSVLAGTEGSLILTSVVPEPSTYALLGGLLALGFVVYRRRR